MSVLNIVKLKDLASNNNLLGGDYVDANFQPSSYDLRIGTIYKNDRIISKNQPQFEKSYVIIKPSEIINFLTLEEVEIPQNLCGTVFALNSLSSSGLLILNPGHIDPGFKGPISVCAINLSKEVIKLSLEESIFTLIIETLDDKVPEEFTYKNKSFIDRKTREDYQDQHRFSKMSDSVFDLVLGYDKANKFLIDRIYDRFKEVVKKWTNVVILIFSLFGGFYLFFPNSAIFNLDKNNEKKLEKVENSYKDSINFINSQNSIVVDSLKNRLDSIKNVNILPLGNDGN